MINRKKVNAFSDPVSMIRDIHREILESLLYDTDATEEERKFMLDRRLTDLEEARTLMKIHDTPLYKAIKGEIDDSNN